MNAPRYHGKACFGEQTIVLRDLQESDLEPLVRYWHPNDAARLSSFGIDTLELGSPEATTQHFRRSLRQVRRDSDPVTLVLADDDVVIGYVAIVAIQDDASYLQAHIIYPEYRRIGIASALLHLVLRTFSAEFPLRELRFRVHVINQPAVRFLAKMGMTIHETRHIGPPDGPALPGHYHLYVVERGRTLDERSAAPDTPRSLPGE